MTKHRPHFVHRAGRSTQMLFFETQVNNLLDSAEKFVILLQKGRLLTFTKNLMP